MYMKVDTVLVSKANVRSKPYNSVVAGFPYTNTTQLINN